MSSMKTFAVLAALLVLSACSRPTAETETFGERVGSVAPTFRKFGCEVRKTASPHARDQMRDCTLAPAKTPNPNARKSPLYCYRTWGQPDCYTSPLPGADSRLMGVLLPEEATIRPVQSLSEADTVIRDSHIEVRDTFKGPSGPHRFGTRSPYFPPPTSGPKMLMPGR